MLSGKRGYEDNLGFLNLIGAALLAPTILAIYFAIRRDHEAYGALGTMLFSWGWPFMSRASRALPMLSLSSKYARATTDAQRSLLVAAGQRCLLRDKAVLEFRS